MRWMIMAACICAIASPALAEDDPSDWKGTLSAEAGFNAARLPEGSDVDIVDESEHGIRLDIARTNLLHGLGFHLRGGITYAPQAFDDEDPSSALYAEIALGDDATGLGQGSAIRDLLTKYDGKVKPYLRLRHTDVQNGFLDGHARSDDTLTGGAQFTSKLPQGCAAEGKSLALCKSDWGFSAGADAARNWSSDQTKRFWQIKANVDVQSPALDFGPNPLLFAGFEASRRAFDDLADVAEARRDWSYKTTGGVKGEFALSPVTISWAAGVRYQVRNSNDDAFDHHRTYGFGSVGASIGF